MKLKLIRDTDIFQVAFSEEGCETHPLQKNKISNSNLADFTTFTICDTYLQLEVCV